MKELDLISQSFWTTKNLKTVEIAEKFASLMAIREDEFTPTAFYGGDLTNKRNIKYDKSKVTQFIEAIMSPNQNYIVLTNSDRKKRDIIYGFTIRTLNRFSIVTFQATHSYFADEERLKKFLDIGKELDNMISPLYGKVHDIADANYIIDEIVKERTYKLLEKIPAVFWGNYFGQYYIEKIGRENLLKYKGHKVEELENGDIYIQTTPSPLNPSSKEDRKEQHKLAKRVGIPRQ